MKSHMSRFLSLILALALSFSLCVPAFAVNEFADVSPDYWAYGDIMACVEAGTVNGVGEGKFDPEGQVTDIQFLVMLTRTFYADEAEAAKTTETSNWYAPYLKAASDAAIDRRLTIQDQALDRYNMASVLFYVLMEKDLLYTTTYEAIKSAENLTDWDTMPDPNINHIFVQYCYAHGILAGMSDGAFHGEQTMTRAQACAVLVRMIKLLNGETLPQPTTPAQPQQPTQPEQPQQPTTPTQPEQPQQPETPDQTDNGTLANGEPATEANVTAMLNELQKKYPAGTAWGESTMYKTPSANAKSAIACIGANASPYYACGGFAAMVSDTIFSNNAYSEITDISKVRPGDFVAKFDKAGAIKHIAIVTNTIAPGKSGNANTDRWKVCICDGNVNGGYVDWAGSYGVFGCGKSNANPYTGEYYRFATRY